MTHAGHREHPSRDGEHRRHGGAGPRATRAHSGTSARRALRRETPSTVALLADDADFRVMRSSYASFGFDDHPRYLRQVHRLLRALAARGTHVSVVRFDPAQYAAYCAGTGRDPDRADTRTRYVAEVAAGGATIPYQGQPLDRLVRDLDRAGDRHASWRRAARSLTGGGATEALFDRAWTALTRLLGTLGAGTHHVVCSVPLAGAPLVAAVRAERGGDGRLHLAETDALVLCSLLAAGIAAGGPGGVVARTVDGTDTAPDRVRGWCLRDGWLHPLTEAQVFAAYCTDARTGDPVPPEPGVAYLPGTVIPPPE